MCVRVCMCTRVCVCIRPVIFSTHLVTVKCKVFTITSSSTREIQLCARPATQLMHSPCFRQIACASPLRILHYVCEDWNERGPLDKVNFEVRASEHWEDISVTGFSLFVPLQLWQCFVPHRQRQIILSSWKVDDWHHPQERFLKGIFTSYCQF